MIEQSLKQVTYEVGEILRYTRYEDDLINYPNEIPTPNKYFEVKAVDMDWGVVNHGKDTIGISYVTKTNLQEKQEFLRNKKTNIMKTTFRTVDELIENKEDCPLPLEAIPNLMGINLVSVDAISWQKQDDGQLTNLTIHFIPKK